MFARTNRIHNIHVLSHISKHEHRPGYTPNRTTTYLAFPFSSFLRYLMGLMDSFNDVTDQLMNKLCKMADGKTQVSMHNQFCQVTLDAIGKVRLVTRKS